MGPGSCVRSGFLIRDDVLVDAVPADVNEGSVCLSSEVMLRGLVALHGGLAPLPLPDAPPAGHLAKES